MGLFVLGFIYLLIKTSSYLVNRFNLQRYYISIPYVASLIALTTIYLLRDAMLLPSITEIISRVSISVFLFSVGLQISDVVNRLYIKRMIQLIGLSILLILILDISAFLISEESRWTINSTMFAYNEALMTKMIAPELQVHVEYWSKMQFGLLFLLTPLFLNLLRFTMPSGVYKSAVGHSTKEKLDLPLDMNVSSMLLICLSAVGLTYYFTELSSYFLFDFVFSMTAGFIVGRKTKKDRYSIHSWGTWGLYSFIVITSVELIYLVQDAFSFNVLLILAIKTFVLGAISIGLGHWLFKKWSAVDWMVGVVAIWTFTLNAPIACMHGMRTVVNQLGPSPYILLVVPPVILWLVNYVHLLIYLMLPR